MAIRSVKITDWIPDSDNPSGMRRIQGLVPTEDGYSGVGEVTKAQSAPSPLVGTPQALLRSAYATTPAVFMGTTGAGTGSRIYSLSAFPGGSWTDRLPAGADGADWRLMQFGENTLAVGGTGIRMKVSTVAAPDFANVSSDVSPKFLCRFGNRVFIANLSWNITGLITVGTSGTDADYVFASNYNDAGTFGDSGSSPGLGSAIWQLKDEFGPITGMAATESYILITKANALIIGRRSTAYDIEWKYIGARFGCIHPRSIVVDGEDIMLWANCGPIRIVGGDNIEQIGTGRISWTIASPTSEPSLTIGATALLGVEKYPISGVQDIASGVVNWLYSSSAGLGVASTNLDVMVHYNPSAGTLSYSRCESSVEFGAGAYTLLQYKAACPSLNPSRLLEQLSPISNILFARANGEIWWHFESGLGSGVAGALDRDPYVETQNFAGDSGKNFRIRAVYIQFPNYSLFGPISVTIVGIPDRATGIEVEEGPFTGIDPQGRIDTSLSSEFQMARVKITFGDAANVIATGAQYYRNIRVFELDIVETTEAGAK